MINAKVTIYFSGITTETCDLDPNYFLDCIDEEDLEYHVKDYIDENGIASYGDVRVDDVINRYYDVPESFFEEWRKLKGIN